MGRSSENLVREHLFEHVLFATDFSENAERAFAVAGLVLVNAGQTTAS